MDRQVEISVKNGTATADSKFIGIVGDANVTKLRVTFDGGWDGYAKTLTMWDARGQNPVAVILGVNLLEDVLIGSVYVVPIPAEPLAYAGSEIVAVFEGTMTENGVTTVQRTGNLYFTVLEAYVADGANAPVDVTPERADQLQSEIEEILPSLQADVEAAQAAQAAAELAETNAATAQGLAEAAQDAAVIAKTASESARDAAQGYQSGAQNAQAAAELAKTGATTAQAAAQAAQTEAQAAQAAIEAMTATASGLSAGAAPTVTKTTAGGVVNLAFAIPKGDTGATGSKGDQGPQGDSIASVYKKSGTGAAGTADTYGVKLGDTAGTEVGTFSVWNGADGEGAGDMLMSVYDQDLDGVVDDAEKLGGQLPANYAAASALTAHTGSTNNPHAVTAAQAGAVPTSRTVNSKALTANITLTASDVAAVPTTRTVNSKALSSDISLAATDVGAAAASHTHAATDVASGTLAVARGGTGQTSVDTAPTSGSSKMVTSGGVYTALAAKQAAAVTLTVTLTVAGWSANSQSVTATGVTAGNIAIVAPLPASQGTYTAGGVKCTSQAANALTFSCETTPTAAIDVGVVIL